MRLDDLRSALCTLVTVPVTPFTADGRLDLEAYRAGVRRLTAGGIRVITPNGNTGEFYSLSIQECSETLAAAVAVTGGQSVVVASVGHDAATATEMARTAGKTGADAVMIHQIVHPFRSAAGWIAYHRAIAAHVPQLGIVIYVRDSQVTPEMLKDLLGSCPNIVGIKYAVPDPVQFATMVKQIGGERLAWICGLAESWAPFFWVGGARGFTSGLVNAHIPPSMEMLRSLQAGDYGNAMRIWAELKPFEDLRARHAHGNNVSVVKEAMAQLGIGTRTVRPPISELSMPERAEVASILTAWELSAPVRA